VAKLKVKRQMTFETFELYFSWLNQKKKKNSLTIEYDVCGLKLAK